MARNKFTILILLLVPFYLWAQPTDTIATYQPNKRRVRQLVIGSTIAYGVTLVGLSELWYKNSPSQSFQFFNDNAEWEQVDKFGHFYSAFYFSYGVSRALNWSHIKPKKSDLIGALTGFMIMAPIELLDGFSSDYGASVGDIAADAAGSAFYLGQTALWKEIRIYPKFSFHRTGYAPLRPNELGNSWSTEMLKDYNGQTYWLSVDVDKFIRFPKWLNLAAGYGASGMVYARDNQNILNGYDPYRQYYLSIDFDLTAIKTRSKALKTLIFFVNMIKIPAPTLELSRKEVRFHFLYF